MERHYDVLSCNLLSCHNFTEFKYMGSTMQSNGCMNAEVNKRIQCGWNNRWKMSGFQCDKMLREIFTRQARNQGGFGGFVRTPLFANPPPKNTNPPPTTFPTAYLTSKSKHGHLGCIYTDSEYITDLLGPSSNRSPKPAFNIPFE